jgi:low affinity Fe/Cu permease
MADIATTVPPGNDLRAAPTEPVSVVRGTAVESAKRKRGWFSWFAHETARLSGRPITFLIATTTIVVWAVTGPLFDYSDSWQLVINTGTTIVTFLMVFLIQNTQNRDTLALQIKLSELIIAMRGAENKVAAAEDLADEELETLHREYRKRAEQTLETLSKRRRARPKQRESFPSVPEKSEDVEPQL